MLVSIVTPTYNREEFLPRLYRCVAAQTHSELELLVCDDSPEPSAFLQRHTDPRLRYVHLPTRASVGNKRDLLNEMARGEVIVHFDDDDYYAPNYLSHVLEQLQNADFTKLEAWFNYSTVHHIATYWNTAEAMQNGIALAPNAEPRQVSTAADQMEYAWGFGFSYAYRRAAVGAARFGDRTFGEDLFFYTQLRDAGARCVKVPDITGLVLHVIHKSNLSLVFGQYRIPRLLVRRAFGPEINAFMEAPSALAAPDTADIKLSTATTPPAAAGS